MTPDQNAKIIPEAQKQSDTATAEPEEQVVGPLSGLPPTEAQGPRRRAPRYYAGEKYKGRRMQHYDVQRYNNGALPGIRNKAARRIIRKAFDSKLHNVDRGLKLARAMRMQAREITFKQEQWKGKGPRAAERLLKAELAIHVPVYVPSHKELRAARTMARKTKRAKAKANKKMLSGIATP